MVFIWQCFFVFVVLRVTIFNLQRKPTSMPIIEFVSTSQANKNNKQSKFLIHVIENQEADSLLNLTDLDLTGYSHILDNFAVIHTFKKHGDMLSEALRGQIAIEKADFTNIPLIIINPDEILIGEKNNKGNILIKYTKAIEGVRYFYVAEIRTGRKEIALQTFYKRAVK